MGTLMADVVSTILFSSAICNLIIYMYLEQQQHPYIIKKERLLAFHGGLLVQSTILCSIISAIEPVEWNIIS